MFDRIAEVTKTVTNHRDSETYASLLKRGRRVAKESNLAMTDTQIERAAARMYRDWQRVHAEALERQLDRVVIGMHGNFVGHVQ